MGGIPMTESKAIKVAIDSMSKAQRRFAVGHNTYLQSGNLITGSERDHKNWTELEDAKTELTRLLAELEQAKKQLAGLGQSRHQMDMFATPPLLLHRSRRRLEPHDPSRLEGQ